MKKIFAIVVWGWLFSIQLMAQTNKPGSPLSFDKFFKQNMKVIPGSFPIYQLDDKYYLQINTQQFNKDILVVGDIRYGGANLAKSSGILQFSKGNADNLFVTKSDYSEQAVANESMANLLTGSTLQPISSTFKIEALGKDSGSYIIDITRQLIEGGELFSFKNYNLIANPDPSRSAVEEVVPISKGVLFNVYRSQNASSRDYNGKPIDQAFTFQISLVFQELSAQNMPIRISDRRIGFSTKSFTDFGLTGYAAKKVNIIRKWNVQVAAGDLAKYQSSRLVAPERPIIVYIHPSVPKFLINSFKEGALAWNKCFETAGFKEVIKVVLPEQARQQVMEEGTIMIAWGGVAAKPEVETVEDPRTGEIKTAKITFSDRVVDNLLQKYFVQCGKYDLRIQKDANSPAVRADILKFKLGQAMAEALGMLPNYAGSTAYNIAQISSPEWVLTHGFTSSITDELNFNFLMVPTKGFNSKLFIPGIGAYDHFAINWAYRQYPDAPIKPNFLKDGKIDLALFYTAEDKSNPLAQAEDLSSQNIEAAQKGIAKLMAFYPELDGIAAKMNDDTPDTYMLLAANFIMAYDQYVTSVLPNIGGRERYTVMKGYNDVPVRYVSKARQQATFEFLYQNVLKAVPSWTRNDRAQFTDGSNTETLVTKTAVKVVNYLTNVDLIKNLIEAENSGQKGIFGTKDLFDNIDRYLFMNFDSKIALSSYQRNIQATFIRSLLALNGKNKVSAGLNEVSVVLNSYMASLSKHIDAIAKSHTNQLSKDHFQLMKMLMDNDLNAK
ncbi:zinc-dependent metalloprotease [uncultured Pedobacter sp.]|uniref:DUF5117 and DUF5118 domain-containing protein n=1 Tax=uncultured Pedobacter sp. TaxID=246139 RepID=UPI0025F3B6E8|nr:zinc-dependent metalloprotease [uncultured Pedobacter sp.]